MNTTFKIGIIGAGNIAHKFCKAVETLDGVEVSAVSSKSLERAHDFADKNNLTNYFDSYKAMLESGIDGVYIATTHNFHYENALLCIEHKKPFICEKSFMCNKTETADIFAKAKAANIFSMEAMWSRYLPVIKKVREWITSDRLGEIGLASFLIGFKGDKSAGSRMYEPSLGGGAMLDIGVYAIEIMTYLLDLPLTEVKSMISYADTGVDTVNAMTLKLGNTIATLNCIISAQVVNELNIYGSEGRIYVKNPHFGGECTLYNGEDVIETFDSPVENGFEYQISDFVQCVQAGKLESEIIPHSATLQCAEIGDICLGR